MAEANERIARIETTLEHVREEQDRASGQQSEHARRSDVSFAEIKDSTLNLRVSVEVLAKTIEQQGSRLGEVEGEVREVKERIEHLEHSMEAIATQFKVDKARVTAYLAGAVIVLTALWALIDDPVKAGFKRLISGEPTASASK
jgi:chromosome segregation ATPase